MHPIVRIVAVVIVPLLAGACSLLDRPVAGSTTVLLSATDATGRGPADAESLKRAREILAKRVLDAGFGAADLVVKGDGRLQMTVPGKRETGALMTLVAPGQLRLRRVLDLVGNGPEVDTEAASGAEPVAPQERTYTADAVLGQLGGAAELAAHLPSTPLTPEQLEQLKPFAGLTPGQVAVLPAAIQFAVPQITCATLRRRPPGSIDDPAATVVACDGAGTKHLLDAAPVTGADVASAGADVQSETGDWMINFSLTPVGQPKWTSLTEIAYANKGTPPCAAQALDPDGHCAVAIVIDNEVRSAPYIEGVITGGAQVGGEYTEQSAKALAAQLTGGTLPVRLHVESITSAD